jgi:hypothetical protein
MAFEVLKDGATIQKVIGQGRASKDGSPTLLTASEVYRKGDIIQDDEIAPIISELYEEGNERVKSLIKKIPNKKTTTKTSTKRKTATTK